MALIGNVTAVNLGLNPNDGTGDSLRQAFSITQNNINSVYTFLQTTPTFNNLEVAGNLIVDGNTNLLGNVTINTPIMRTTANGTAFIGVQQDGTGRSSWCWNAYSGSSPVYISGNEDASALYISSTNNGNGGSFFHRSANGNAQNAGNTVAWVTTIYSDLNNFSWRGFPVLTTNNYTTYTISSTGTGAVGTWNINVSGTAATVSSASQPTITSVGPLTGLLSSGPVILNSTLNVGSDTVIGGNLIVNGSTTTISSSTLSVADNLIYVGVGNGADTVSLGLIADYHDATLGNVHAGIIRDPGTKEFYVFKDYNVSPTTLVNISGNGFTLANLHCDTLIGNIAGTVTAAAQPAITSLGTLAGLTFANGTDIFWKDNVGVAHPVLGVGSDNTLNLFSATNLGIRFLNQAGNAQLFGIDNAGNVIANGTVNAASLSGAASTGAGANGTWPISITGNAATATNANNLDGLALNTSGTNNVANQVMRTDGSGYANFGWINTISGDNGTTPIARVYASSDNYIRTYTIGNFSSQLSGTAPSLNIGGTATYLSGTQQTNIITGAYAGINPAISTGQGSFICRAPNTANLAGITMWNDAYALYLGVDNSGVVRLGGWSRPQNSWYSDASGNMVAAGNVSAYSDPKLKENFTNIQNPMDIVLQLNGGTFTWKKGFENVIGTKGGNKDYGILADQVEAVMPEIVTESIDIDGETYKTVDYSKIVPVLIEAIKELKAEIEILKAR